MTKIIQRLVIFGALSLCCGDVTAQSTTQALKPKIASAGQKITAADLKLCANKVSEFKGTFYNSVYRLKEPLRQDRRFACLDGRASGADATVVYYAARAELVSGYGGLFQSADSKFLWCRFNITKQPVVIEEWSIGMQVKSSVAQRCGFK